MAQNLPGTVESVSTEHKSGGKNGLCNRCVSDKDRSKFDVALKALCLEMRIWCKITVWDCLKD